MQFDFSKRRPSDILQDFNTFLEYIEHNKYKATNSLHHLSSKDLFQLNQGMQSPQKGVNERSRQPLYPMLHLFYHLFMVSGLGMLDPKTKSKTFFTPSPERYEYFRSLNETEQYFFLFKTLFQYCDFERISTEERGIRIFYTHVDELFKLVLKMEVGKWTDLKSESFGDRRMVFRFLGALIQYFSYLGFWECERDTEVLSRTIILISRVKISTLGRAFAEVIVNKTPAVQWNQYLFFSASSGPVFGSFFDMESSPVSVSEPEGDLEDHFRHLFPEGRLGVVRVQVAQPYQAGKYVFKIWPVYHPKVWRRVEMTDQHTLEELHLMIQKVFDFDNDHLYSFFPDGDFRSKIAYHDSRGGMGLSAEEVTIGEIFLKEHQTLAYLFDYGDEWMFYVELEKIEEGKASLSTPRLLESKGKSPEQYPDWGEGW
jgi:hypothetical protein